MTYIGIESKDVYMYNLLRNTYPSLDLHGEEPAYIYVLIDNFIKDNIHLKHYDIVIIHGKGTYAVRDETLSILKKHPLVHSFKINEDNSGETIVILNKY